MAAAGLERSVGSTIATALDKMDDIFFLKKIKQLHLKRLLIRALSSGCQATDIMYINIT